MNVSENLTKFIHQFMLTRILTSPIDLQHKASQIIQPTVSSPKKLSSSQMKQRLIQQFQIGTHTHKNQESMLVSFGGEGSIIGNQEKSQRKMETSLFKKQKQSSPKIVKIDISGYPKSLNQSKQISESLQRYETLDRKRGIKKSTITHSTSQTSNCENHFSYDSEKRDPVHIEIDLPELEEIQEMKGIEQQKKIIREIEVDIRDLISKIKSDSLVESRTKNLLGIKRKKHFH